MKKLLAVTILILLSQTSIYSQVNQDWVRTYGGPLNSINNIAGIKTNNSGNIYVSGSVNGNTLTDYFTLKYNSAGILLWERIYSGLIEDRAIDMVLDSSGNVYVTGLSENTTGTYDIITIKYNTDGDSLWVRRYNGPNAFTMDQPVAMTIDIGNNIYVCGYSFGSTTMSYVTIKYNADGDSLWTQKFALGGTDTPQDIYADLSGNIYIYGRGARVLKYNSAGNLLWHKTYSTISAENSKSFTGDNSGNLYFGGTINTNTFGDFATTKINSNGDTLWMRSRNGLGNTFQNHDEVNALEIDKNGNVYTTGKSYFQLASNFSTIKYNSDGIFQWERNYLNVQSGEGGNDIAVDNSGNIFVTGGSNDFTTIKYNSNGDSIWSVFYNGPTDLIDIPDFISTDISGNVYVTGRSRHAGSPAYYELVTIKYSQTLTGISSDKNIDTKFELYQNYPNPFNPETKISYELTENNFVSLKVYDILGNEISQLVNKNQNPGKYSVDFNARLQARDLSSGIYFYQLTIYSDAGNYSQIKKMTLLK